MERYCSSPLYSPLAGGLLGILNGKSTLVPLTGSIMEEAEDAGRSGAVVLVAVLLALGRRLTGDIERQVHVSTVDGQHHGRGGGLDAGYGLHAPHHLRHEGGGLRGAGDRKSTR